MPLHQPGKFALIPLQFPIPDLPLQILACQGDPLLILIAEIASDLAPRTGGLGDVEPVRLRTLAVGGDDADGVAILQHIPQPDVATIDPSGDAVAPDVGMDGEGEVEHCRPLGQLKYLPLGRKDVHLLVVQVHPEVLDHLILRQLVAHLQHPPRLGHQVVQPGLALDPLIPPVRRQTSLGDLIHPLGPDLHLHPAVLRTHDGDMEALIAVALRDGDPVLKPLRIGLIHVGDDGVDMPAVALLPLWLRVEDDADGKEVVDLLEGALLHLQLVVDRRDRLRPPLDMKLQSRLLQPLLQRPDKGGDVGIASILGLRQLLLYIGVRLTVGILECQVVHLALDRIETHAMGVGGKDRVHLVRQHGPLPLPEEMPGESQPHKPVGDQDQNDPHILCKGEEKSSEIIARHHLRRVVHFADPQEKSV